MSAIRDRLTHAAERWPADSIIARDIIASLFTMGATEAIFAIEQKLHDEDLARIYAGEQPKYTALLTWLRLEAEALTPAELADAVTDAVHAHVNSTVSGVSDNELRALANERQCEIQSEITDRWMRYGEYLTVEFDTETWTATVLPASVMR